MKRRWRSLILRICVFLLLGAIVNVAVAWALVAMNGQWRTDLAILQASASLNATPLPAARPGNALSSSATLSGAPLILAPVNERKRTWCYDVRLSGTSLASRASVFAGWPFLGLETARFDGRIDQLHQCAITGPADLLERPIWPGFAINTVFYAATLWMLFAAPFALRRWRRIKRGQCPACGYRVGTSPVCTECGKPLPIRPIQAAV